MITLDPVKYQSVQSTAFNSLRNVLSSQFDVLIDNVAGHIDGDVIIKIYEEILEATFTAEELIFDVLSLEVSKQAFCDILTSTKTGNGKKY